MTKPYRTYRTHLLERLQTQEDRVGYLRAAFDEDSATFERAMQDVCDSVAREAAKKAASQKDCDVFTTGAAAQYNAQADALPTEASEAGNQMTF